MSETIGTQLRAAREARHLSIEDVAHSTRIHRDILCQLEADDYSKFPNVMFLKSFLKLYSGHIDCDASEEIARLNTKSRRHGEQYLLGGIAPQLRESYGHLTSRIPVRPILASLAIIALLAVCGNYLVSHLYANEMGDEEPGGQSPRPESPASAEPEIVQAAIAITDNTRPSQIETKLISSPAPTAPKAIPTIYVVPEDPEEFEIGEKEFIDPDDIPRAAPIVREEEPSESQSPRSGEAPDKDEDPADGSEPAVDIPAVEE